MAELDLEALLRPVSDSDPCGKDLEYDPEFMTLQELARGKPAVEMGTQKRAAEPPPWPKVRTAAEAMFSATKDLRVAGVLHESLVRTAGMPGLASGLALMSGLLGRYWDHVHPRLDADDDNDPTFRVNALVSAIASDEAIAAVRLVPLVESRQFGRHCLRGYRIATGMLKAEGDGAEVDPAQELVRIESAASEADTASLQAAAAVVASCAESVNSIQKVLLDKADGIPPSLNVLAADLRDMRAFFETQLAKRGAAAEPETAAGAAPQEGATVETGGPAPSGDVRNRADVTRAIDRICEYYRRAEPSSPVPLLLERAKRLVNKDFMDIVRDLTPAGLAEAEVIVGLEKK